MKRATLSKALISLALTMALAFGAVALAAAPARNARAEDAFTAEWLVQAGADVTAAPAAQFTKEGGYAEAPRGLLMTVPAETKGYSFGINGIFGGNVRIDFNIPGQVGTDGGFQSYDADTVFEIYDVATAQTAFEVHFGASRGNDWNGWNGMAWLTYDHNGKKVYRSGNTSDSGEFIHAYGGWGSGLNAADNAVYYLPQPEQNGTNGENAESNCGYLILQYNAEGNLEVWAKSGNNRGPARMAVFEDDPATYTPDSSTGWHANCNLPKLNFAEGFGVRVRTEGSYSAGDQAVLLLGITESEKAELLVEDKALTEKGVKTDLSLETLSAPAFYETYNSATFITLDGKMPSVFAVGYTRTLPAATYTDATGSAPAPVEKITLTDPENHTTDITATREVTPSAFGDYTVTYIAEVGAENVGNELTFTFNVSGYGMEAEGLFDYGSDALYSVSKTGDYTGVHFVPVSSAGYKAGFNGVFTGDTELIFRFPSAAAVGTTKGRSVTFTVSDLDGNEAFRVEFSGGDGWDTLPTLFYENEIRAGVTNAEGANQWTPKIFFTERLMDAEHGCGFPYFNATNNAQTGSLSLEWEDDVLAVYYIARDGREKLKLAAFDGTDTTYEIPAEGYAVYDSAADINENGVFALPKIYDRLKGGYSISMQVVGETTVNFVSVNGVSLSDDFVSIDYAHEIVQEEEQNGTIYVPQGCDIAPAVVRYETIVAGGWKFINEESAAIEADTSSAGTKTFVVESDLMEDVYQAVSKEYTVVVETAYKLIFDTRGGDAITAIDWSEHTAYRLGGAFPVPVRDYWKFDGWYADAAYNDPITLEEIKAEKGTVTVYAKWLDDVAPVIELDGAEDVSTVQAGEVVVGESDVRVTDAAQGDDVTLTIEVKYQNGAFEALTEDYDFTRVGAYVIRYTAKDPSGNAAYVERTINVIDELPPEITLSGEIPESGFTGIAITLPAATATENAQVVLTVTLNGEEIALSGNAFTPTVAGEYEAVYSATDANDNTATVRQVISVADDIAAPVISGGLENSVVKKGTEVSVTAASATDNCDGSVTVTYKVYYGTEEVAVENGKFKAENIGVYRVEYTARDSSGNVANKNVEITVTATGTTDGGDGANSGSCNSSLGGAPWIAGFALAAAAALAIAKRGRARKNKGR